MIPTYRGWIPTITGNLSFSVIGASYQDKKIFGCYRSIEGRRYSVAVEDRYTSDALWISDWHNERKHRFLFAFFGVSTEEYQHKVNTGSVFIIDLNQAWRWSYLWQGLSTDINECLFERRFSGALIGLNDGVASGEIGRVSVSIDRSGLAELQRTSAATRQEGDGVIVTQAYYFLRDVLHKHQHHEISSDTILKCYKYSDDSDEGMQRWKRETLYALYRWIIQQKRSGGKEEIVRCLGVAAYAESFSRLHVNDRIDALVPKYNPKITSLSLRAALKEREISENSSGNAVFFSRVLPAISILLIIVVSVWGTQDPTQKGEPLSAQQELISLVFNFASTNPVGFLAVGLFPLLLQLSRTWRRHIWRTSWMRTIQRFLLSVGKFWARTFTLILSSLLFVSIVALLA